MYRKERRRIYHCFLSAILTLRRVAFQGSRAWAFLTYKDDIYTSARPARRRSRVATPSATPQRFQDFTKDFKISLRFQDFTKDFTKISRFHQRFQDFTKISRFQRRFQDFKISPRFQDFKGDFKISVEISAVVYEISASGGPLVSNTAVWSFSIYACLHNTVVL